MSISPVPLKSPCQVHATFTQQTANRFPLPLSQDSVNTLVLMWLANFANDASSMVHLRSPPWHIPCQPYGRLSIVVHYPSVSIRAAQSGLQSAPACRMRWGCHHLFRSYNRNLSNIANIRLHSVSGHTSCWKDKLLFRNRQTKWQNLCFLAKISHTAAPHASKIIPTYMSYSLEIIINTV